MEVRAPVEVQAPIAANMSWSHECDFAAIKADAYLYFASSWDPIFSIILRMQSAYASGGAAAATEKGFDALQRIADARGTRAQRGSAANGDALTKHLLACMNVGTLPTDFSVAAALSSGIFEVRGASNPAAALAYDALPGHRAAASPLWGVEAPWGWSAKFYDAATRFLVYGAPRPVSTFTDEQPSTDPSTNAALAGFDISTVPTMPKLSLVGNSPHVTQVLVGICIDPGAGASQPINRLLHAAATDAILALTTPSFCNSATARIAPPAGGSGLFALIRAGAAFFTPQPLEASAFLLGGVGGLASGLSPFGSVAVSTEHVTLTFVQQPSDGRVGAPIKPPVAVRAVTAAGTPIAGVEVKLCIAGDDSEHGRKDDREHGRGDDREHGGRDDCEHARGDDRRHGDGDDHVDHDHGGIVEGTGVATTNDAGIATFPALQLIKAGGYLLQASGSIGGGATKTAISRSFNIKQSEWK